MRFRIDEMTAGAGSCSSSIPVVIAPDPSWMGACASQLRWLSDAVAGGARATVRFAEGAVTSLGNRDAVDFQRIRDISGAASAKLRAQLGGRDPFGTFELEGLGTIDIHPEPQSDRVHFETWTPAPDGRRDARRIRRVANGAMKQLRESQLPGVLVLDVQKDGLAWNSIPFLAHWAASKSGLIAVLVVERHSFSGGSCWPVEVLPGPEFDAASDNLLDLLEVCDADHFHYAPLSDLATPCPLAGWVS